MTHPKIAEENQPEPFFEHDTETNKKKLSQKLLQRGMYFSGYFLFLGGILLFLWLGATSDFPSPSSTSQGKSNVPIKSVAYTTGGPRLTLKEESFDFGKISQEEEVEHTLVFTNTGDEDLIIQNIDSS